jgi:multiple sugar transport system substrate-binding protein
MNRLPLCPLLLSIALLSATAGAQDLKLTGWPYEVDIVNDNLSRFQEQTGVTAKFEPFPSDNYHDKMVTSFVGGTDYDVVYVRDNFLAEWASAGWIVPIDGMQGVQQYLDDLPSAVVDQLSYDGQVYGLPYYSGMNAFAYNADHLEQAGIDSPPGTWEELLDQARAVKEAGVSEHPIILQLKKGNYITTTLEIVTAGMGGTMFDEDFEATFAEEDSDFRQAVDWIRTGIEEGLIDEASLSSDDHDVVRAMSAGTHTFTFLADYNLKTVNDPEQSQTAGDVEAALIPGDDEVESGTTSYVRLYAISKDAEDKEAAWQLVQFLGGRDATGEYFVPKRWALDFGLGFAYSSMYEDADIQESLGSWIDPSVLQQQAAYTVNRAYRFTPFFSDWQTGAWGDMQNLLLGSGNADRTYSRLASNWDDLKSSYGY